MIQRGESVEDGICADRQKVELLQIYLVFVYLFIQKLLSPSSPKRHLEWPSNIFLNLIRSPTLGQTIESGRFIEILCHSLTIYHKDSFYLNLAIGLDHNP